MSPVLELVLLYALTAVGLTQTIRKVPPFSKWTLEGKRPWSCDLCMSFWTAWAAYELSLVLVEDLDMRDALLAVLPAIAVALFVNARIYPGSSPPELPPPP